MDFKKILDASKLPIVIGVIFNVVLIVVNSLFSIFVGQTGLLGAIVAILAFLPGILMTMINYTGNALIYSYAGFSAAKKFRPLIECGVVSSFSFVVVSILSWIVLVVLLVIQLILLPSSSSSSYLPPIFTSALVLGLAIAGLVASLVVGTAVNFVLGLIGGLLGGAK